MDEGWIITTAITLGIGVISYFLKRTMNQLDCTVQQLQKIERDSVTKADLKETTDELKKTSIRSVRIIHPRRLTARILMGARRRLRRSGRIT